MRPRLSSESGDRMTILRVAPGRPGVGERVVGVRGEDVGRGERAGELVDAPAEVHHADHVQRAAGEHARQAAPQAVPHAASSLLAGAAGCLVRTRARRQEDDEMAAG